MKGDGRGGTEVSVKTTSKEEDNRLFEVGAYATIMERTLLLKIEKT